MRNRFIVSGMAVLHFLMLPTPLLASDGTQPTGDPSPELIRVVAQKKIPDLVWDEAPVQLIEREIKGFNVLIATFVGRVPSLKGSSILYIIDGKEQVARVSEKDGSVKINVPITGSTVRIGLQAIDSYGNVYDDAVEISSAYSASLGARKLNYDLGMGISSLNYTEKTGRDSFQVREVGITPKFGVNYRVSPQWEVGGNAFITAIPFRLSTTPSTLYLARWYGLNSRLGYKFWQPTPRAGLYLLGGYYLWGMIAPAANAATTYGVSRLGGPQVFITGRFRTELKRTYTLYAKYAVIQNGFGLSMINHELAAGGSYQIFPFKEGRRPWMLSLDYAVAQYSSLETEFRLKSLTLGMGTSF